MTKRTWISGFCGTGDHGSCPSAVRHMDGTKVAECACRCQHRQRCLECGNTNPAELTGWACTNPSDCRDAIAARSAANPLRKELETVRMLGGEARRRALHERTVARIRADVAACGIDDEIGHDVASDLNRPRRPRKPRQAARPTSGTCICGCEGTTKGGRFLPGHDAKLKGTLKRAASAGDASAVQRLIELGWEKFIPADAPRQLVEAS